MHTYFYLFEVKNSNAVYFILSGVSHLKIERVTTTTTEINLKNASHLLT